MMIFESSTIARSFAPLVPVLAVLVALPLTACSDDGATGPATRTVLDVPASAEVVPFDLVEEATTSVSGIRDARRLVVTEDSAWTALWDEMHFVVMPKPSAPSIDFSARMVLAATLGEQSSGGYGISIPEVAEDGDALYVVVEASEPGPGCVTADVITTPAVAVSVPRRDGDVLFVERSRTVPCGGGQ